MSKQLIAILLIIAAVFIGILVFNKDKKDQDSQEPSNAQPTNHVVGAGKKKVTLIEYGDFECPACKQYYPLVKQVKEAYGDDITFQFRNFPLTQIHPNAFLGHRAAEAAGKQGKFFEMHDLLYENQADWSKASDPSARLASYATELGLNIEQFKTDMKSAEAAALINADVKAGQEAGANSTPTFVLNGRKIEENPRSLEDFKKLIDEEIKKANPN